MQLSVVIVNYNVKYFLEQALHSVYKAMQGIEGEVFVVDNNSADGSCEMVKRKFPQTILIENKKNTGFSFANNQAIKQAKGKYVLLLNPDTVVEEDCFSRCIAFMEAHNDAGALGVKMIDGKGHFLPESKRGLPTPDVAFYKMSGLSALFPKSKRFGRYHLSYLGNDEVHEVDALAGAFMFIRTSVLDEIGLLDEDYFMYGEDIDLSYRITKAGYKNYYFPGTTIIHYKGESTKKTSVNYVFVFYRAMNIFAAKHYNSNHARFFSIIITLAIYLRAGVALVARFFERSKLLLADAALFYAGVYFIKIYWEKNHRFVEGGSYPLEFMLVNASVYTLMWVLGLYFAGAYENPRSIKASFKGVLLGLIGISILYAFAPLSYRYSRAIIMLAFTWAMIGAYLNRLLLYVLQFRKVDLAMTYDANTAIVGNREEALRVSDLLVKTKANCRITGFVSVNDEESNDHDDYLGPVNKLKDIVQFFNIEQIVFCSRDISSGQIIQWMGSIHIPGVQFKIVPEESSFIIGSNNKNTSGDFYTLDLSLALSEPLHLKKKRMLDVLVSFVLLALSPLLIFVIKNPLNYIRNLFSVLLGRKTWVGYMDAGNYAGLPKIKSGVLNPASTENKAVESVTASKLNRLYARNYTVEKDLYIILVSIAKLGS